MLIKLLNVGIYRDTFSIVRQILGLEKIIKE